MSNDILKGLFVSVGFKVDANSQRSAMSAVQKYEQEVAAAEKRIDGLRVKNAKTNADREKILAEVNLKELKKNLEGAKDAEKAALARNVAIAATVVGIGASITAVATKCATALGEMIGKFDVLYYVSGRTGASVNNIKALGYAFEQTGSSAARAMGMLENFAKARRTNPGVDALLKNLGVNTKGDTADVLGAGIDAISARHPHFAGSQVAGILGISEEDYEHFTRYRKEIKELNAEREKLRKSMGVNGDETASAAHKVSRSLGSLSMVGDVLGEKLTQSLAPSIEKVAVGLKDWIQSNPEKVEAILRGIGNAAEWLGRALIKGLEWISDEENQKKIADFWLLFQDRVGSLITRVTELLRLLLKMGSFFESGPIKKYFDFMFGGGLVGGALFGGSAQAAEAGPGGAASANDNGGSKPGVVKRAWNAVKRAVGLGGSGVGAETNYPAGSKHPILDLITRAEGTKRGYDDSFAHQVGGTLTDKTLDEVQGIQKGMRGSSAIGKYQFMRATLNGLRKEMGLRGDEKFDPVMQDRLALRLYERRMAQAKRKGGGEGAVLEALAQEWASFPTQSGQGYYPGQRASVSTQQVLDAVRRQEAAKNAPAVATPRLSFATPGSGFNPGGFDVNAALRSAPMGTSSTTNNQSSMNVNSPTNVTIHGVTDTQRAAEHFERAANRSNDLMLRNVQAAAR